jgi:acyl-CoA reductase-like NAD-dependent aldehyde dehydrogenase
LETGGKRIDRKGYFLETTIFSGVDDNMTIAKEEIFGPVKVINKFKHLEEAITRANNSIYGLSGGVVTSNINTALEVSKKLKAGMIYVNCWVEGLQPATPFGGYK